MTLKTRFIALFIVLIVAFSSIALFTSISLSKINKFTEIDKKVYQLYNISLELKKNEGDYFNWGLKDPTYFETGKSEYSNQVHKNYQASDEICAQLFGSGFIKRNKFTKDIDLIKQLLSDYHNQFSIIEKNKFDLGFENWGLLGQMNTSVLKVENEIQKQNNVNLKIQLLTLRQHEKDYLFRKNFLYKELFDRELFSMQEKTKLQSPVIYSLLKDYGNSFNNLVEKDFYIGVSKNDGLMASLENKGTNLNNAITSLSQSISKKTNHYINQTTVVLLIFIVICTLFTLLSGSYIIKHILKLLGGEPEQVAAITKSISKGDLRFQLGKSSEYHGVMKSVVVMTEKLKGIISGIYHNSYNIASAGKQFSETSQKISVGAINQSSLVEDISARIEIVKQKTGSNLATAIETDKIAMQSMDSMHKIKDQSDLSLLSSNKIADKVQIIDQITFQTKILALNTAVEAARVGDAGNGFQVIADEIQRLAEVSKQAAIEIKRLTDENQNMTGLVRNNVSETMKAIEKTSELVRNIAEASKDQDTNINQISTSVYHLHAVSQENAAVSEEMAESTEELEKQIIELKQMVSYFKVGKDVENGSSYALLTKTKEKKRNEKKKKISLFGRIKNSFQKIEHAAV
jgi:methyl-accepting chemotaxis protein